MVLYIRGKLNVIFRSLSNVFNCRAKGCNNVIILVCCCVTSVKMLVWRWWPLTDPSLPCCWWHVCHVPVDPELSHSDRSVCKLHQCWYQDNSPGTDTLTGGATLEINMTGLVSRTLGRNLSYTGRGSNIMLCLDQHPGRCFISQVFVDLLKNAGVKYFAPTFLGPPE